MEKTKMHMTVVLCSKGYPSNYKKNIQINNLNKIKINKNNFVFHAEPKLKAKKLSLLEVVF